MKKIILSVLFVCIAAAAAPAQQKPPDLSGTWKMNLAKSDFGALPGPESRVDVITHKEPSLTDDVTAEGPQGKQHYIVKYTTDGKEVTNQINDREVHSTLKWEGNVLKISSKFQYNDSDVDANLTWTLSPDGKTLTIAVHYASAMGETDQKIIMEKQEPAATPAKTP